MKWIYAVLMSIFVLVMGLNGCYSSKEEVAQASFLNLHDSVEYVGMQMCRSCHNNVYETYIHTGMGQSFGAATPEKSKATFGDHALVYDAKSDFYYKPFFKDSNLYITEFRVENGDTMHKRTEQVAYIIGSGHHTNSHLIDINGYVYQAPITYYTQDKKWDLAPGFEEKNNRFGRLIAQECLTCHNHLPPPMPGAINKYREMPLGIECERCHGPGEIHVREKLAGKLVDTSKFTDYTIVNPANLSIEQQMDLCQRCHLQGVAVLNEGKTFYDFKPGMRLADVMNVFLPRFTNSDERFIMASQADRLRLSNCYTESKQLSCITCHNPHHDVHSTTKNTYNQACQSCHNPQSKKSQLFDCSAPQSERNALNDNCVHCHMPPSGSIDIPHVNITDHYISRTNIRQVKDTVSEAQKDEIAQFLGLESLIKKQPTALDMVKGYLALYDKFMQDPLVLDSIRFYLQKVDTQAPEGLAAQVHFWFILQDYERIAGATQTLDANTLKDGWTAYRIGESNLKMGRLPQAKMYLEKAVEFLPYHLDFQEKLGVTYAQLKEFKQAQKTFEFILSENPKRKVALSNLGFMFALQGQFPKAMKLYNQALALDPDYKMGLLNKAGLLLQQGQNDAAKKILEKVVEKHPNSARAKQILEQLQ